MNGKKAKAIRRLVKDKVYDENSKYKTTSDFRVAKKTPKSIHIIDELGKPQLHKIERVTVVNANKYEYRRLKKAYKNGEFTIS